MLRPTVSRPVRPGVRHSSLPDCCGFVDVGRPLWRKDGSDLSTYNIYIYILHVITWMYIQYIHGLCHSRKHSPFTVLEACSPRCCTATVAARNMPLFYCCVRVCCERYIATVTVTCLESRRDASIETLRIDRCIGSNNSSIVTLTEVSTVLTKGPLSSNARTHMRRNTFAKSVLHWLPRKESCINLRGEKSWYNRDRRSQSRINLRREKSGNSRRSTSIEWETEVKRYC
jgi:hypothetical protein